MEPFFSIIVPTKNNEKQIGKCLKSIELLDYPKNRYEVIVSDGHSSDKTVEIANRYNAKVFYDNGGCRASGCNIAFNHAKGDFVAFTDADCTVDKQWLKNSLKYFERENVAGVGGPNFPPQGVPNLTRAVDNVFLSSPLAINFKQSLEVRSLAGCNGIYRKKIVENFFPIPETKAAEDTLLNYNITVSGYKLLSAPDVIVFHDRHYKTRVQLLKQMILYGKGNAEISRHAPKILKPLQKIEAFFLPIIVFGFLLAIFNIFAILYLATAISIFCFYIVCKDLLFSKSLKVALLGPQVLFLCLFGLSIGFLKETIRPRKDSH